MIAAAETFDALASLCRAVAASLRAGQVEEARSLCGLLEATRARAVALAFGASVVAATPAAELALPVEKQETILSTPAIDADRLRELEAREEKRKADDRERKAAAREEARLAKETAEASVVVVAQSAPVVQIGMPWAPVVSADTSATSADMSADTVSPLSKRSKNKKRGESGSAAYVVASTPLPDDCRSVAEELCKAAGIELDIPFVFAKFADAKEAKRYRIGSKALITWWSAWVRGEIAHEKARLAPRPASSPATAPLPVRAARPLAEGIGRVFPPPLRETPEQTASRLATMASLFGPAMAVAS